jgi:response regulator RpfG family c-di-GMP phosphodiesterase
MKILYVEDDPNIAEIYMMMIKERFHDTEIVHFQNGLHALQELKHAPEKFDLIISDYQLSNMITGADIFKFVNGQMLGLPFIILSGIDCSQDEKFKNFFEAHVRNALLLKPVSIGDLTAKIEWCLAEENNLLKIYNQSTKSNDEKIPIRSDLFLKSNLVPCDVYLKLRDGKYIKIIHNNEPFEGRLIQKLILKGATHFFVNRSEISQYGESVINTLHGLLKTKAHKAEELQKSQITNKAIEVLRGNLLKCGFNKVVLKVADDIISLQLEMMTESPEIEQYLNKFQNFRRINTDHTRLVSYVVVSILRELTWDSESTLHKMCTAALLHDISLPDGLVEKVTNHDNFENLTDDEKNIYFSHPTESSHIAQHFEAIAIGIEQFILEHHELPNGKGFPRKLNYNNVHPLSCTLHFADLTADLLWKFDFDVDKVREHLMESRQYYQRGFYRKPYDALINVLKVYN